MKACANGAQYGHLTSLKPKRHVYMFLNFDTFILFE